MKERELFFGSHSKLLSLFWRSQGASRVGVVPRFQPSFSRNVVLLSHWDTSSGTFQRKLGNGVTKIAFLGSLNEIVGI
jgi:hypothetical protein